jgi:hypothetical protein
MTKIQKSRDRGFSRIRTFDKCLKGEKLTLSEKEMGG